MGSCRKIWGKRKKRKWLGTKPRGPATERRGAGPAAAEGRAGRHGLGRKVAHSECRVCVHLIRSRNFLREASVLEGRRSAVPGAWSQAPAERPGRVCVVAAGGQDDTTPALGHHVWNVNMSFPPVAESARTHLRGSKVMRGPETPNPKSARMCGTLLGAAAPPSSSGRCSSVWAWPRKCPVT